MTVLRSLLAGVLFLSAVSVATARADTSIKLVVIEAKKIVLPNTFDSDALIKAATSAAITEGADAVPSAYKCPGDLCWANVALSVGATHVLMLDGWYDRLEYKIDVFLWSVVDREQRSPLSAQCKMCSARDMIDKVGELSRKAVVIERNRLIPSTRPAPVLVPAKDESISLSTRDTPPQEPSHSKALAYTLLGTGAAAAVTGALLWYFHDRNTACELNPIGGDTVCRKTYRTPALLTWPLVVVGAGTFGYGVWKLKSASAGSARLTFAAGPSALVLEGSFW